MTFKEWLPIARRNRVALGLAGLALVMFVVWNCLPYYESQGPPNGIVAVVVWPEFLSPEIYVDAIRNPDAHGFLVMTACLSIISGGLIVILAVPLWQILHASKFIRLPIALLNLHGGAVITWFLFDIGLPDPAPYSTVLFVLMGLSLFSSSASFFLFQNELALREARSHARPSESG